MDFSTFCLKCLSGVAHTTGFRDRVGYRSAVQSRIRCLRCRHHRSVRTWVSVDGVGTRMRVRADRSVVRIACRNGLDRESHDHPQRRQQPFAHLCLAALVMAAGGLPALPVWAKADRVAEYRKMIQERTGGAPMMELKASPTYRERQLSQPNQRRTLELPAAIIETASAQKAGEPNSVSTVEDVDGDGDSGLNLGTAALAAGLWLLFLFQKRDTEDLEIRLDKQEEGAKVKVQGLEGQLREAVSVAEEEKQLVERLRSENSAARGEIERKLELERKEKEAVARERDVARSAMKEERRVVEAIESEAAAIKEAIEGEKAAKYAAKAEAEALQNMLNKTSKELAEKTQVAESLEKRIVNVEEQLEGEKLKSAAFAKEGDDLKQALAGEKERAGKAETEASGLKSQLQDVDERLHQQTKITEKLNKQTMNLNEALSSLKTDSAKMAEELARTAQEASAFRARAEEDFMKAKAELDASSQKVASLRASLADAKGKLGEREKKIDELTRMLEAANREGLELQEQIRLLKSQAAEQEMETTNMYESQIAALKTEADSMKAEFLKTSFDLRQKISEDMEIQTQLKQVQKDYSQAIEQLEAEQNASIVTRAEIEHLQGMVSSLEAEKGSLTPRLKELEQELTSAKDALAASDEMLAAERRAREDAALAASKLQSAIATVNIEVEIAQQAAEQVRADLEEERRTRMEAEDMVKELKQQLETIKEQEESKRLVLETELDSIKAQLKANIPA